VAFFNQISANQANFHNFMVKVQLRPKLCFRVLHVGVLLGHHSVPGGNSIVTTSLITEMELVETRASMGYHTVAVCLVV
jgi:hypothetical protein